MSKASPIIAAFNAGEWSPLLDGRVDLAGYGASAHLIENFIPTVQGPLIRRGGTVYVGDVEDHTKRSWLVPFIRSRSVAYVVEFGQNVCRFWFDRAQVIDGTPYEIASPWATSQLVTEAGEFALDYVQSADVLYITHRSGIWAPRKLTRTSSTSWAFSTFEPDEGPWLDLNATATTVYSSDESGTVTLTASTSIFTADHVGALIRLDQENVISPVWDPETGYTNGNWVRWGTNEYRAEDDGTTATVPPTHTQGQVIDGTVPWSYRTSGYGVARITAQAGTTATATVLTRFPRSVVGSGNTTTLWRFGAWSEANGYPTSVSFFNERLCFAAGQRVDMSQVADYENFSPDQFGEITAESAISVNIQSSEVNEVVGLVEADDMVALTEGGEFTIGPLTNSEPFGPGNIRVRPVSGYGGAPVKPLRVGEATLFVQAGNRNLREAVFDIQVNSLVARDLTVRAEHITRPRLVQMVRQERPFQLCWGLRSDGELLVLTYDRTQEVRGWAHELVVGIVESLACIPSPDGDVDDVWMTVRRTVDGETVRYVEYLAKPYEAEGDAMHYVDSGLVYDGSATDTISGLDHLEGRTVRILADGATHPDAVVESGSITLNREASVVYVGLPFAAKWASNRIEAGASDGTSQTKTKRITDVAFRVLNTLGGAAGPDEDHLDDIPLLTYRSAATPMGEGAPLYSGDAGLDWPGGYGTEGRIWYVNDTAFPATLIACVPQVVTQEAR